MSLPNCGLALVALVAVGACTPDRATDPLAPAAAVGPELATARGAGGTASGTLYTMTNAATGNEILRFTRGADGSLAAPTAVATGGLGAGAGLGNQGALALSEGGRWLFAVNPGSNDVSAFRVVPSGLQLVSRVASGGTQPISLTLHRDVLYVLNAGGAGNIAGFTVGAGGLTPIPGSTRPLSGSGVGPAQIGFHPNGRLLVVTEKATNLLTVYQVDRNGLASSPSSYPSSGMTPFGFGFDRQGTLVVSEAFGGSPDASAASSYRFDASGVPVLASASVPNTESAACWIAISGNGRFAYTTNTGSGTISRYAVSNLGELELLDSDGVAGVTGPGTAPIDMAMSRNGRFLYALNGGNATLSIFRVEADGALASLGTVSGLPATANGLIGN